MSRESVENYINHRYDRYLDYSSYHAALAGIPDESGDILNTVLLSLLKKDPEHLQGLLDKKKQGYTELDFFILRMIKLNSHSMTSPYRHKTKNPPIDANVTPMDLDIIDEMEDQVDHSGKSLQLWSKVREILGSLDIPARDKEMFSWKFFADNSMLSWPGEESYSTVCTTCNRVMDLIMGIAAPANAGVIALPVLTSTNDMHQLQRFAVRFIKAGMNLQREETRKIERLAVRLLHVRAISNMKVRYSLQKVA